MTTKLRLFIFLLGLCFCSVISAQTPQLFNDEDPYFRQWAQPVDTTSAATRLAQYNAAVNQSNGPDTLQVYASDGYLYVNSPQRYIAQVYSIVGQLVYQEYVNPGFTEINIQQPRGIYIVRIGNVTKKVIL